MGGCRPAFDEDPEDSRRTELIEEGRQIPGVLLTRGNGRSGRNGAEDDTSRLWALVAGESNRERWVIGEHGPPPDDPAQLARSS